MCKCVGGSFPQYIHNIYLYVYIYLIGIKWAAPQMLFVHSVPNDSIYIRSLPGSEQITFTATILPNIKLCLSLCHPALHSGNTVPEHVNLVSVQREGKTPLLLKERGGVGVEGLKRGNEKSPLSQKEPSQWSRVSSGFPGLERRLCKQGNADGRST